MTKRLIFLAILLISVCVLPIYISIPLAILGLFLFENLYELIPIFFLNDVLYGIPMDRFFSFPYVMTLLSLVAVLLSVWLRALFFRK